MTSTGIHCRLDYQFSITCSQPSRGGLSGSRAFMTWLWSLSASKSWKPKRRSLPSNRPWPRLWSEINHGVFQAIGSVWILYARTWFCEMYQKLWNYCTPKTSIDVLHLIGSAFKYWSTLLMPTWKYQSRTCHFIGWWLGQEFFPIHYTTLHEIWCPTTFCKVWYLDLIYSASIFCVVDYNFHANEWNDKTENSFALNDPLESPFKSSSAIPAEHVN